MTTDCCQLGSSRKRTGVRKDYASIAIGDELAKLPNHPAIEPKPKTVMYVLQWQSTREPLLKVEQANPLGRNSDSRHILNHRSKLRYPGFTLLLSEIAFRSQGYSGTIPLTDSSRAIPRTNSTLC